MICPGNNAKKKKQEKSTIWRSIWTDDCSDFSTCPRKKEKPKKVDNVKLNLARFGSIRLDFEQIVQIFPDI